MAGSFPASDPPAWTATRAGPPEGGAERSARQAGAKAPPPRCEAIAAFAAERQAQVAADALLAAGFNAAEIKPSRASATLAAELGLPRSVGRGAVIGVCAAIGGVAAAIAAALIARPSSRSTARARAVSVAAGGVFGGLAGAIAAPRVCPDIADLTDGRGGDAWLLCFELKSADDERRALLALQENGARMLQVRWTGRGC